MGNNQSTSQQIPLRCILDNWKMFDPLTIKRSGLKFFCAIAWPQYSLGDKKHWPEDGSLNYNTILQLDLFCKRQGKWTEIPYVQIFFQLRDMKELCLNYGLVVHPKSEPTRQMVLGIGNQEQEPPVKAHLPWLLSCLVLLPQGPNVPPYPGAPPPQKPTQLCPLVETGGEFVPTQVHKPFSLLELRQIKQNLESYTDDPGKYIDRYILTHYLGL